MSGRDRMFRDPASQLVDFTFDAAVAEVFPDMIRRSVPGYETIIPLTGMLAARQLRALPGQPRRAYDLGCSLGATTSALLRQLGDHAAAIVSVDSSGPMIEHARTLVTDPRVTFLEADIRALPLEPAGVVLLNFVLQFITPDERVALLRKVHTSIAPEGLLIVSEKVRFEDPGEQAFYDAAHLDFKRANGYSELEIARKRTALENVMIIDSEETHRQRFSRAGFSLTRKWYQCLNWVSYLVHP